MNPSPEELEQMQEAMLEYFTKNNIQAKKPEDLTTTIHDIVDILQITQLYWSAATRRDLTCSKKR